MIIPDINLLVYAYNADAPFHESAKKWWEDTLTQGLPVGLPWSVAIGFIRLMTDNRVLENPLGPAEAVDFVESWLNCPGVSILEPGARHLALLKNLFKVTNVAGRLTTDTHIAAIALEYHGEVHSNDRDFDRFTGLRRCNPLE